MGILLATILLAQAAPAQSEADQMEAALKKFGDRTYSIIIGGEPEGFRTLKTSVITDQGRKVVVLEVKEEGQSGKTVRTTIERAELNGIKLISVETTGFVGKSETSTIKVDGLKATLKYAGEEVKDVAITDRTVGEEALLRRVCAAEQKEGTELVVDVLRWPAPDLERARTLKCEGLKPVEIRGKKVDAYLWTESWGAKYWVSPDGYLVRWTGPGGVDYVLDAK
jgi:hypothetical protein